MELGGGGLSRVELGARFSNPHFLYLVEQIWNKSRQKYLFILGKSFLRWLKNFFVLSNQLDILSYVMYLMYAVTKSVNSQQDNISYDDNVLYLIPRSRF